MPLKSNGAHVTLGLYNTSTCSVHFTCAKNKSKNVDHFIQTRNNLHRHVLGKVFKYYAKYLIKSTVLCKQGNCADFGAAVAVHQLFNFVYTTFISNSIAVFLQ